MVTTTLPGKLRALFVLPVNLLDGSLTYMFIYKYQTTSDITIYICVHVHIYEVSRNVRRCTLSWSISSPYM